MVQAPDHCLLQNGTNFLFFPWPEPSPLSHSEHPLKLILTHALDNQHPGLLRF